MAGEGSTTTTAMAATVPFLLHFLSMGSTPHCKGLGWSSSGSSYSSGNGYGDGFGDGFGSGGFGGFNSGWKRRK